MIGNLGFPMMFCPSRFAPCTLLVFGKIYPVVGIYFMVFQGSPGGDERQENGNCLKIEELPGSGDS
jgi:hypothetical protein